MQTNTWLKNDVSAVLYALSSIYLFIIFIFHFLCHIELKTCWQMYFLLYSYNNLSLGIKSEFVLLQDFIDIFKNFQVSICHLIFC